MSRNTFLFYFLKRSLIADLFDYLAGYFEEKSSIFGKRLLRQRWRSIWMLLNEQRAGAFDINTPQDRQSHFEPQILKKCETILADNLQDKIIGLYGLGMSLRDIRFHIKEMYDTDVSHTVLSQITNHIIAEVKAWQNRPLSQSLENYQLRDDGQLSLV